METKRSFGVSGRPHRENDDPTPVADSVEIEKLKQVLKKSERNLLEAQRIARLGSWTWSLPSGEISWSKQMYEIFEVDPFEFKPSPEAIRECIPTSDLESYKKNIINITEDNGDFFDFEHKLITPSGKKRTVWIRGEKERDDEGKVTFIHGTTQDISERKNTEEKLRNAIKDLEKRNFETRQMLESARALLDHPAFEQSARKIFDCCQRVTGATAGYVALLDENAQENELLFLEAGGRPCSVNPELPMPIRGLREVAYRTCEPAVDNRFSSSQWMEFMPNGHVTLDNVLFAPLVLEGKAVGLIGLANKSEDFTEEDMALASRFADFAAIGLMHNQALEALRDSEGKYRALVENAPVGILYMDRDGKILELNDKFLEILGSKSAEYSKQINVLTFPPIVESGISKIISDCMESGRPAKAEAPYISKWGKKTVLKIVITPMLDKDSAVYGCLAVVEDVLKEKILEERLRESQKFESIGVLAGGIAHEFNNLLQIIGGHAELILLESAENGIPIEEPLIIKRATDRGADLVKKIMIYSGTIDVELKPINLSKLVKSTIELFRRTIPEIIDLELDIAEDVDPIMGNPAQIEQLILNIAVNAKEAMPMGGTLSFHTSNIDLGDDFCQFREDLKPGEHVLLRISDTGLGMEESKVKRIFEPFYTTKKQGEGTGLGLSAVFGIARMHGAAIEVTSIPGKGTSFYVYFPTTSESVVAFTGESPKSYPMGSETVMVVDDELPIRRLTQSILEKVGYKTLAASNGEEALEIYSQNIEKISLVIMDLVMPGIGGEKCLDLLRRINPKVKAVIISGHDLDEFTIKSFEQKNIQFIQKPYDMSYFLNLVRDAIDDN